MISSLGLRDEDLGFGMQTGDAARMALALCGFGLPSLRFQILRHNVGRERI